MTTKHVVAWTLVVVGLAASGRAQAQRPASTYFVYDANGRITAVVTPAGEAAVYEYDSANNLTAIGRLDGSNLRLLSFFPESGGAGDLVTLVGTGLAAVTSVRFNGAAARIVDAAAAAVVAEVPDAATTGPITVATQQSTLSTARSFAVVSRLRVAPSSATLTIGQTQQFVALSADPLPAGVQWSADAGTISSAGLYQAPASAVGSVKIRAASIAAPDLFGQALVTVRDPNNVQAVWSPAVAAYYGTPPALAVAQSPLLSLTTGPAISSIEPNRMARGTIVSVTARGMNLQGITALRVLDGNGAVDSSIQVSDLAVDAAGATATAVIKVGTTSLVGTRLLVLTAAAGASQPSRAAFNTIEVF